MHNQLGCRYQEKYYQRAVEEALKCTNLKFQKELKVDLKFNHKVIGKYYLDFLIEDKVILELKTVPALVGSDIRQVLAYLKAKNLKLGILANFRKEKVEIVRVLNSKYNS